MTETASTPNPNFLRQVILTPAGAEESAGGVGECSTLEEAVEDAVEDLADRAFDLWQDFTESKTHEQIVYIAREIEQEIDGDQPGARLIFDGRLTMIVDHVPA